MKPPLEAECLHCVYSSLRESATTFAVESLRLVRGVTFDLLLLGAVLSTRRLCCMLLSILHCQAMLRKNSGTESSFESQSCLRLTLIWLKVKKTDRCASSAFHNMSERVAHFFHVLMRAPPSTCTCNFICFRAHLSFTCYL